MSFVDLKEIFEQLTSWKIIPHLRNASSKIQLFFPEKYALIKRSELPTYHPQSNHSTHWLADNSLFNGEQIGFCSLCKNVQTSDRPHYLSGFCTNNKNSTELKWVFWNLLIRDGKAVLEEMEEKTSDILKNACVIPGTQIYDDLLKKLSEWLADVFPFENYRYLYHDANNLSDTVNKYLESNLSSALSRVIASCAIAGLNNQKINTAVRNNKEVKTVSWTNGANSKRQEQALNIIWPANAIEENSWRALIRKGDHDLGIGKARDAFLSYAQAANLAEALPNRESIEEYQRLIIQWMRARLLSASTDTLKVSARKEWDNLCKKHNSPYQSSAIFLRGQLKEKGYEYEQSSEDAFSDYLEAANHQDAPCEVLIVVGQAFMYGSYGQSSDPQKAYTYFKKGYDKGNAQCAYHLAKLCEKHSELLRQIEGFDGDDLIQNCYERAAKGGIVSADKHLRNLRFCSEIEPNFEDGDLLTGCVCLLNSNHGSYANAFISNQNDFDGIYFGSICTLLANKAELLRYQKIVFAFFSDDHAANVSDAVNLIRYMNDYSDRYGLRADWKRCELFVLSKDESASYIIDSATKNLIDGVYFKIHLIDPDEYAVDRLILEQPTFIPCISKETPHVTATNVPKELHDVSKSWKRNIVVIGTDRLTYHFIKQVISCTYLSNCPTTLSIIGENADALQRSIEEECYGIFTGSNNVDCIIPEFYTCDPRHLPIHKKPNNEIEETIQGRLRDSSYIVVCTEDDDLNLRIGIKLRSGLLAYRTSCVLKPYITIRYKDPMHAWLATRLTVSHQTDYSDSWTTEFALNVFGSYKDFSYSRISSCSLNSFAMRLHKSYYGITNKSDDATVQIAMRDYYQSSYNRSSSKAQAIAIIYELFAMGIFLDEKQDYAIFSAYPTLSKAVHYYLTNGKGGEDFDDSRIKQASEIEHERWNCYMLANGWRTAFPEDYRAYINAGNGKHHLEIAKLHPYIVPCDQLDSVWKDLEEVLSIVPWKAKQHLQNPKEPDIAFVKILHELIVCENQSIFDSSR